MLSEYVQQFSQSGFEHQKLVDVQMHSSVGFFILFASDFVVFADVTGQLVQNREALVPQPVGAQRDRLTPVEIHEADAPATVTRRPQEYEFQPLGEPESHHMLLAVYKHRPAVSPGQLVITSSMVRVKLNVSNDPDTLSVEINGTLQLSPQRWQRLMDAADDISSLLNESASPGWTCPTHIGGRYFASVFEGDVVKIAGDCLKGEGPTAIVPGPMIVSLNASEWQELSTSLRPSIDQHLDVANCTPCYMQDSHNNQMGYFACAECTPFPDCLDDYLYYTDEDIEE